MYFCSLEELEFSGSISSHAILVTYMLASNLALHTGSWLSEGGRGESLVLTVSTCMKNCSNLGLLYKFCKLSASWRGPNKFESTISFALQHLDIHYFILKPEQRDVTKCGAHVSTLSYVPQLTTY